MGAQGGVGASAAERFARGEMPVLEFWRRVERGWHGRASVGGAQVARLIGAHLKGQVAFAQLSAWAGTIAALSCFDVRGVRVRAALSRLACGAPEEPELRKLVSTLARSRRARRASGS